MSNDTWITALFELAKLGIITWMNYAAANGMTEAELDAKLAEIRAEFVRLDPANLPEI